MAQMPDLEKELVDLKSPSAEDISKVLQSYQNQVRTFRCWRPRAVSVANAPVCLQSSLDSEKPFVLEKHLSDINRWVQDRRSAFGA